MSSLRKIWIIFLKSIDIFIWERILLWLHSWRKILFKINVTCSSLFPRAISICYCNTHFWIPSFILYFRETFKVIKLFCYLNRRTKSPFQRFVSIAAGGIREIVSNHMKLGGWIFKLKNQRKWFHFIHIRCFIFIPSRPIVRKYLLSLKFS